MANGKIQPFISLDQSKHHCYALSTRCLLFTLASEVGPRTKLPFPNFHFSFHFYFHCILSFSVTSFQNTLKRSFYKSELNTCLLSYYKILICSCINRIVLSEYRKILRTGTLEIITVVMQLS